MSKPKQLRCYTCLQLDRELRPLKAHAKCLFTMLCPEMFTKRAKDTAEYLVCWECEFMANKIKRFQDKLKKANEILKLSLKGKITIVEGLSTQKITKVEIISVPSQAQKLPQEFSNKPKQEPFISEKPPTLPQKPPILPGQPPFLPQKPPILPGQPPFLPQKPPILPQKPPVLPQKPSILPPKPSIIINPQNILKLSLKDMLDASKFHTQSTVKIELNSSDDEGTLSCSSEFLDEGSCSNDYDELILPPRQVSCDPLLVPRHNQPMPWTEIEVPPLLTTPIKDEVITPVTRTHYAFPNEQILRGFREPVKVTVKNPRLTAKDSNPGTASKDEGPAKCPKKNDLLRELLTKKPSISGEKFVFKNLPYTPNEPECRNIGTGVNYCECCDKDEAKLIILNEKELKEFREKRKKNTTYGASPYKCESCIEWFRRREKFDEHKLKHDESRGKSICGICEQRFADDNDLNVHYKQHFIVYECMKCPYRSNDRYKLSAHCRLRHEESSFTCKKCFEVFKTIRDRRSHIIKVHDQKLPCKECTKTFPNNPRLKLHIRNVHRAESVKCPICKRKIKPYYLKNHIKNHSNQGNKEYCAECKVFYKTKYSYQLHLKNSLKHNSLEKLGYKCDHCDKYFGSKESLKNHVAEIGGEKYTCDICKKDSKSKKVLASHIAQVHYKIMPKTKPKICEFCGKSFTIRKSLVEHINSHLGIRPNVCKDCGATFVYSAALFTHRRLVHKVKRKSDMTS